jgi:hypothetical protein
MKYFYGTLIKLSRIEDTFVSLISKVKDHTFRKDLMYDSSLRKYLFELAVNEEVLYYQENSYGIDDESVSKLIKNIRR